MNHLVTYKIFESGNVIMDTINDILIEINDIDGWEATSWLVTAIRHENLEKDIVVIIKRNSDYNEADYDNELEVIKSMRIPTDITNTIKRLIDYLGSYDPDISIGSDDVGPDGDNILHKIDISDSFVGPVLVNEDGSVVTKLWMNEFIRIEFSK